MQTPRIPQHLTNTTNLSKPSCSIVIAPNLSKHVIHHTNLSKPTCQNQPVVYHKPPKQIQAIPKNPPASRHLPQQAKQLCNHQARRTITKARLELQRECRKPSFSLSPSFLLGKRKASEYDSPHACRSDKFTTEDAVKAVGDVEVIKDEHSAVQRKEYARCGHRYQSCGHATPKQRRRLPSPPAVLSE